MTTVAPAPAPSGRAIARACLHGWSVHVPGRDDASVAAERAHELLGRKGLLYKEPATRLALCAVHRALGLAPGARRAPGPPDPDTAVVASSNLGNVETVVKLARIVREGRARDVSPLDAPNASSNVIASTVAIWFGFGGPNLMVCSGATAGLDAVALAHLLLRAGRARRVVVVGAEPDDPVASALRGRRRAARAARGVRAGAAAVVIGPGAAPGAPTAIGIGAVHSAPAAAPPHLGDGAGLVIGPRSASRGDALDLEDELGDLYGALGVVQLAVAAGRVAAGEAPAATVVCGDALDGWRAVTVAAPGVDPDPGRDPR